MAKKKRKGEKEETYEWVPPEFDEKAFLETDIMSTKSLMVSALLAVIFGIIAFALGALLGDLQALAFVVIIIGAYLLTRLYGVFKIDASVISKGLKAGNIAIFVLLALGVWIMLMNEPFSA